MVVYKITNTVNGKIYIGKTIHEYDARWKQHCSEARRNPQIPFHHAIAKYGEAAFQKEVIAISNDPEQLNQLEIEFITKLGATIPGIGYNRTFGGDGILTEEARRKISENTKRAMTPEVREKMSGKRKTLETHCRRRGHVFDAENTIIRSDGGRRCKACRKIYNKNWYKVHGLGEGRKLKIYCKRGHAFDSANTRITPTGARVCRACRAILAKNWKIAHA